MAREEEFDEDSEYAFAFLTREVQDAFGGPYNRPEELVEQYESAKIAYYGRNMANRSVSPTEDDLALII